MLIQAGSGGGGRRRGGGGGRGSGWGEREGGREWEGDGNICRTHWGVKQLRSSHQQTVIVTELCIILCILLYVSTHCLWSVCLCIILCLTLNLTAGHLLTCLLTCLLMIYCTCTSEVVSKLALPVAYILDLWVVGLCMFTACWRKWSIIQNWKFCDWQNCVGIC